MTTEDFFSAHLVLYTSKTAKARPVLYLDNVAASVLVTKGSKNSDASVEADALLTERTMRVENASIVQGASLEQRPLFIQPCRQAKKTQPDVSFEEQPKTIKASKNAQQLQVKDESAPVKDVNTISVAATVNNKPVIIRTARSEPIKIAADQSKGIHQEYPDKAALSVGDKKPFLFHNNALTATLTTSTADASALKGQKQPLRNTPLDEDWGEDAAEEKKDSWLSGTKRTVLITIRDVAIVLALLAILLQFFAPTVVHESSMENTFNERDILFMAKSAYWFDGPSYDDLIVFKTTDAEGKSTSLVKRVIGLPGDTILISNGKVIRNEKPIAEPYLKEQETRGPIEKIVVPAGHYYVLGDNREVSRDSRDQDIGYVSKEQVTGKIIFKLFPLGDFEVY